METSRSRKNTGQILVIVSLMLLGLLSFMALILDGGNLYTHRREAQLAADAGALAGARTYCLTDNVSLATASAQDYATVKNGAQTANVSVLPESGDVTVDTSISFDTFFLGLLGRHQMTANASATAICTPPTGGVGVMPIAWSCKPPGVGGTGDLDCEAQLMDYAHLDPPPPNPSPGECVVGDDPVYIIVDSATIEEDIVCDSDQAGNCVGEVCYVDCDLDDDGVDDLEPLSGGNRSWLDLDGGGGGAADLKFWIEFGLEDPVEIHTWFAGQTGVEGSVYKAVDEHQLGNDVIVPVFDAICPSDFGVPGPENATCEWHGEDYLVGDGGSKDYFHVISFSIFRVTCVDKGGGGGKCPAHMDIFPDVPLRNIPTIEGCFVEGFNPNFGGGGGPVDVGADIIYLKR